MCNDVLRNDLDAASDRDHNHALVRNALVNLAQISFYLDRGDIGPVRAQLEEAIFRLSSFVHYDDYCRLTSGIKAIAPPDQSAGPSLAEAA